jgi:hypothetical protein
MTLAVETKFGVTVDRQVSIFMRSLRRAVLFIESVVLET